MAKKTIKDLEQEVALVESKMRALLLSKYNKIKLTHSNLDRSMDIIADHISAVLIHKDPDGKEYTGVYTPSGAFPAKESPETINKMLTDLKKEALNGI